MIKRNISFIVTNQFFTTVADRIFDLGILWYVYQMTDSALFASFVRYCDYCINSYLFWPCNRCDCGS